MDERSGDVYIANCGIDVCLDYERQKTYSLTYSATDGGGKVTSVNIFVDVLDENDNAPEFAKREYRRTVDEGAAAFDPPLFVKVNECVRFFFLAGFLVYSVMSTCFLFCFY